MKDKSILLVLTAAVCWGVIGIFVKLLSSLGLDTFQLVAVRIWVSVIALGGYLAIFRPKLLKVKLCDCGWFVGTGIVSLLLFNWCYFTTMQLSSLSVAAVLLYTSPIFVVLLSRVFFKEPLTRPKLIALVLTFLGCVCVTGLLRSGNGALSAPAVLCGLGSGIGYALYSIFGRFALRKYESLTVTFYTFCFAAIGITCLADIKGLVPYTGSMQFWLPALGLGIICCLIPYLCYTKGLEKLETGRAAIVVTLEPVVAAAIGIFLYHESVSWDKLLGMGLVFFSIVLLNLPQRKGKKEER